MKEADEYHIDPNVVEVIVERMAELRCSLKSADRRIELLRAALEQAAQMKTIVGARNVAGDALRADDDLRERREEGNDVSDRQSGAPASR